MASSMLMMSDHAAVSSSLQVTSTASVCSASLPIAAARRTAAAAATNIDFSAYLLSASPPGFELSPGVFACGLSPSQRLANSFQVIHFSSREG